MATKLIVTEEAEEDLSAAFAWYESKRLGLGVEFLNCVDACVSANCRLPKIDRFLFKQYRRRMVLRFPYAVFYEAEKRCQERARNLSHLWNLWTPHLPEHALES